MKKDITELFCMVDDFTKYYAENMQAKQLSSAFISQGYKKGFLGLLRARSFKEHFVDAKSLAVCSTKRISSHNEGLS
jgi:hypothetical protein